jgi:hypothetical protein
MTDPVDSGVRLVATEYTLVAVAAGRKLGHAVRGAWGWHVPLVTHRRARWTAVRTKEQAADLLYTLALGRLAGVAR